LRVIPTPVNISSPSIIDGEFNENGWVSFASWGPGVMGVKIYTNTSCTFAEDWLAFVNNKIKLRETQVLEKKVLIDEQEALVTYPKGGVPPYKELPFLTLKKLFL